MQQAMENPSRILRLPEVMALTACSKATLYRWARQDLFPKPVKVGPRVSGWRACDIETWLESRAS